jgi:hypothetical protein
MPWRLLVVSRFGRCISIVREVGCIVTNAHVQAELPIMGLTSLSRGVVYQCLILACLMGMEGDFCKGEGKFL